MSDEAAPYYTDMIDQQACGHQFLLKEFGSDAIPKTGWQIDPFGHSAFMGNLYAQMGMDSWFFGRIDYQDRAIREANHTAEVIMRTSASLGAERCVCAAACGI
jgi:alpha-mannosidase